MMTTQARVNPGRSRDRKPQKGLLKGVLCTSRRHLPCQGADAQPTGAHFRFWAVDRYALAGAPQTGVRRQDKPVMA